MCGSLYYVVCLFVLWMRLLLFFLKPFYMLNIHKNLLISEYLLKYYPRVKCNHTFFVIFLKKSLFFKFFVEIKFLKIFILQNFITGKSSLESVAFLFLNVGKFYTKILNFILRKIRLKLIKLRMLVILPTWIKHNNIAHSRNDI